MSVTDKYTIEIADSGILVDPYVKALKSIDVAHNEVHRGVLFSADYVATGVGNNASVDVLFVVGDDVDAHFVFDISAGGAVQVYLYEAPTISAAGTAVTAYNLNRTSANVPASTVTHTPTVTATGTTTIVNGRYLAGGASAQTRIGGGLRPGIERLLAGGETYLLRVTNVSGSAITISAACEWYEGGEVIYGG